MKPIRVIAVVIVLSVTVFHSRTHPNNRSRARRFHQMIPLTHLWAWHHRRIKIKHDSNFPPLSSSLPTPLLPIFTRFPRAGSEYPFISISNWRPLRQQRT